MSSKKRPRKSALWNYFQEVANDKGTASCNTCGQVLSYRSSISNLKKHMVKLHPKLLDTDDSMDSDGESSPVRKVGASNGKVATQEKGNKKQEKANKNAKASNSISESMPANNQPTRPAVTHRMERDDDDLKLFFLSMYHSARKLKPKIQRELKTKILGAVTEAEANEDGGQQRRTASIEECTTYESLVLGLDTCVSYTSYEGDTSDG